MTDVMAVGRNGHRPGGKARAPARAPARRPALGNDPFERGAAAREPATATPSRQPSARPEPFDSVAAERPLRSGQAESKDPPLHGGVARRVAGAAAAASARLDVVEHRLDS